jgi:hypothetical protein
MTQPTSARTTLVPSPPGKEPAIPWLEWSEAALQRARDEKKPIALHIGATWCHWCHVMDESSYTWAGVATMLAERFICIRVDTDRRPDVNERYNQGGWPTFAILDAAGEVLIGRTYVPGMELLALLRSASDPASRWTLAPEPAPVLGTSVVDAAVIFERVQEAYDPYNAGFGEMQKFPHPMVLDWLLDRVHRDGDAWAKEAVTKTLAAMATKGMYDHEEGGFFRYATQDDWTEPHYEKLLEDHGRLLGVYAREAPPRPATIESAVRWLLATLHDPQTGAFFGSQDADESYYRRPLAHRSEPPPVDRTVYAGWNGLIIAALVRAGAVLGRPGLLGVARLASVHLRTLIASDGRVRRHLDGVSGLLEDQVQVAEGMYAVGAAFGDAGCFAIAAQAMEWAWVNLRVGEGQGLYDRLPEGVGRLRHARRHVHGNAAFARVALLLDAAGLTGGWRDRAQEASRAALAESEDWGFFAAPAAAAAERLAVPVVTIKVASPGWPIAPLLLAGLADPHPDHVWMAVAEGVPAGMAMACSGSACGRPTADYAELMRSVTMLAARP